MTLEIVGNQNNIIISMLCHQNDLPVISAAFHGKFERCELSGLEHDLLSGLPVKSWVDPALYDFFPLPPYSHLLTRPDELRDTTYEPLVTAMSCIPEPAIGLYQAIFQPVDPAHNWHRNVQVLLDFEYAIKLMAGAQLPQRYAQQAPSGDLHQMAWDVENKAHNDKPFYAAALRVAVLGAGDTNRDCLHSLATFASLFQHGGRPLNYLTADDYALLLSPEEIREIFLLGLTYRPGFLVNSWELTGTVHIPPASILDHREIPLNVLETLPVRNKALSQGTPIGTCNYAGKEETVCIPEELRKAHTHIIGRTRVGKSTLEENMVLDDIDKGAGVAVLDPHGDLVERLLCLVPESQIGRVMYLNPGDPDWVPIWNPLSPIPGQDVGRTTDNIVGALKSIVTGWGDRLEHLLRHAIFALLQLPSSSLLDVSNLLRNTSAEAEALRKQILQVVDNDLAQTFWLHDFKRYGKDDLGPPKNKLSKLLLSGTASLMLSQPDSLFNLRRIMDDGMILLVNLSPVGSQIRETLGSFLLSLLHLTALSRSDTPPDKRKPFHIYCDEAHRFMTDAVEDLIAETRKYAVSLTLAHHYMSQFGQRKTDAISSVGTTIIFNVDTKDACHLIKDLRRQVRVEDLISLDVREAIARIGTEIVGIKTCLRRTDVSRDRRERIIAQSRQKYYRPVHEVREIIRRRRERWHAPFIPVNPILAEPGKDGKPEQLAYDEL